MSRQHADHTNSPAITPCGSQQYGTERFNGDPQSDPNNAFDIR